MGVRPSYDAVDFYTATMHRTVLVCILFRSCALPLHAATDMLSLLVGINNIYINSYWEKSDLSSC